MIVLAAAAVAVASDPESLSDRHTPRQIVFVCEHGSVKSLVATEYFNQRAGRQGLSYVAVARGTAPAAVPSTVRSGLEADGFDLTHFTPRRLEASDLADATLVISFDQDLGGTVGRTPYQRWDDLPALSVYFVEGRMAIVRRVDALIKSLTPSPRPAP
jgi:hypothetical protein